MNRGAQTDRWGDPLAWWLYERLGPRYPITILILDLSALLLVFAGAVALLPLWIHMSLERFLALLVAALILQSAHIALSVPGLLRRVRPLARWLRGDHSRPCSEAAWHAGSVLPQQFFQDRVNTLVRISLVAVWCGFATWQLHLPAYALPILAGAAAVAGVYANALVFFMFEVAMQPPLYEIADELGEVPITDRDRVALRTRLLTVIPAIAVITAFVVAGIDPGGHSGPARLALDMVIAVGVTATISLLLTWQLAGSIVNPLRALGDATDRVARGELGVRVPVVSSDETGELTRSFNRMVSGLQERERLRQAFGTFVDPDLAERVLRDGTSLAGEEVEVSIAFVDVRNFTAFAERADAQAVVARLNSLYEQIVPVVLRHGGHANKFIGDGLLAIFGAPERVGDHADRAVAAAIEIAEVVRERYRGELRVGIGVNSGRVVVGTIGGGGRLDFTAIGDPVNTASRVESATRVTGDDVLITEATRTLLRRTACAWERREPIPLKGKRDPVALFAPAPARVPVVSA